ncbi:NAD(P)-dependent oxidoreductase [Reinekea blandensis]|uniref:3-hydroxyisobutyrate dehydrogenase n=1 Tax=Reinekea blandensis MED297 TaxID=314283 RepID=A4BGX6_9GAMM|nr:NAD(P)-dependent oxidoreductase [Reinekea blandensis]EAR08622.1 hypothetical protein MED297_02920 [Reinekea sp. MED297] [Reinekea blandensis MED297]
MMKIGFIGFGEAGQAIWSDWHRRNDVEAVVYDLKLDQPDTAVSTREQLRERGLTAAANARQVCMQSDLVFSLVTADQAEAVVTSLGGVSLNPVWFVDANSCSPTTKQRNAQRITELGGRYIDMAIMAPILPLRSQTPVLVAGPNAEMLMEQWMQPLQMSGRYLGETVGKASSVKMIRSVMVKGMEALTAECLLSAQKAGVSEDVMQSLAHSHPSLDWPEKATYNLERMIKHGQRRSAEMREVESFLNDLGFYDTITHSVANWQQRIGGLGLVPESDDVQTLSQTLLHELTFVLPEEVL